jgi:hypothetical protein
MSIENNETHPSKVIIVRCSCDEVREVLNKLDASKYSFNIEVIENTEGNSFKNKLILRLNKLQQNILAFWNLMMNFQLNG